MLVEKIADLESQVKDLTEIEFDVKSSEESQVRAIFELCEPILRFIDFRDRVLEKNILILRETLIHNQKTGKIEGECIFLTQNLHVFTSFLQLDIQSHVYSYANIESLAISQLLAKMTLEDIVNLILIAIQKSINENTNKLAIVRKYQRKLEQIKEFLEV